MGDSMKVILCFIVAVVAFVLSIRSFMEKGYLLNNAYIFASKEERERMNKKMYYRQSAVCFFMAGIIMVLNGLQILTAAKWLFYAVLIVAALVVLYAIGSTVIYVGKEIKGKK